MCKLQIYAISKICDPIFVTFGGIGTWWCMKGLDSLSISATIMDVGVRIGLGIIGDAGNVAFVDTSETSLRRFRETVYGQYILRVNYKFVNIEFCSFFGARESKDSIHYCRINFGLHSYSLCRDEILSVLIDR
jgi:hypothetical protein